MTEKTVWRRMAKICIKVKTAVFGPSGRSPGNVKSYARMEASAKGCVTFSLCDTQFLRTVSL